MIVYILMGNSPYIKYKPWGITQYTVNKLQYLRKNEFTRQFNKY